MDRKHYNELILVSQEINDTANDRLKKYLEKTYSNASGDTMSQQLEDWLFIAEETCSYLLGNVIALLDADSRETEIKTFESNLRRVISYVVSKQSTSIN